MCGPIGVHGRVVRNGLERLSAREEPAVGEDESASDEHARIAPASDESAGCLFGWHISEHLRAWRHRRFEDH